MIIMEQERPKRDPNYKPHPGSIWLKDNWNSLPKSQWVVLVVTPIEKYILFLLVAMNVEE